MKKFQKYLKRYAFLLPILFLTYPVYYCWVSFPIATGYGAKVLGSAVFISGRNEHDVIAKDLNFFPVRLATFKVNRRDSSVVCSMFGFASQKTIWRNGAGVTLVNDVEESALRSQHFPHISRPYFNTDTIPWPMGDKITDNLPPNIDSMAIQRAAASVFNWQPKSFMNETRALLVLYDGKIVLEKYHPGYSRKTLLAGWSMTKSLTGALVGVLVKQGRLQVSSPAPIAEWNLPDDKRRAITIKNLLQQTSGLDFDEVYDRDSDANRMLFRRGNAAAYAASIGLAHTPGDVFSYSSGNSNLLSRIIRNSVEDDYHSFPYRSLFHAIGMYNTILEPDASGTFVGSSFCYATARDWARFGLLYLQDGMFNNTRILPEGWVRQSVTPSSAASRGEYGYQWWLNTGAASDTSDRIYPALPRDMYFADGYEGQNIFIIPSKKVVVVRLGLTRNKQWGESVFIRKVLDAIQ